MPRAKNKKPYQIRQFNDQSVVGNLFLNESTKLTPQQIIYLTEDEARGYIETEKPILQPFYGDEDMADVIEWNNWAVDPGLIDMGYEANKRREAEQAKQDADAKDAEIASLKAQLAANG